MPADARGYALHGNWCGPARPGPFAPPPVDPLDAAWRATISGARALGYTREDGAKLAMLMSIPTILASGLFLGAEVVASADMQAARDGSIAAGFAFLSALVALSLMMRLLKSVSFTPYVIYRVVLGVVLLVIAYS